MTDTANHQIPKPGKLRRAFAGLLAWMEAMDATGFDYTLNRIERLEREVGQLKKELRQSRDTGLADAHNNSAAGSNIDGTIRGRGQIGLLTPEPA